jgi:formate-dependent nitrite reductase membrane component NrfD
MFTGKRGNKLRTVTQALGIVAPALLTLLPFGGRAKTLLASALTLAGGYVLRETLIEAGKASADDPRAASRQPE